LRITGELEKSRQVLLELRAVSLRRVARLEAPTFGCARRVSDLLLSRTILLLWVGIAISFIFGRDITAQETRELPMIPNSKAMALKEHGSFDHLTTHDTVRDIVNHPAFKGFSRLILPGHNNAYHDDTPLSNVRSLMPYHSHVDPDTVVTALNRMIDEVRNGKKIFFDFYTEQQKQEDAAKENTGLFFFRGEPGAPFAIVCPGGGFSYIGSLHEGFPLALEISKKKYNAFVIRYRIESEQSATEDLAAAIAYIFRNAKALGVSTEGYSLWGGSAGARMVGNIALSGVADYGGGRLPKPAVVVIAYTGQSSYSKDFPPTFIMVSANDGIANAAVVDKRVEHLRNAGVEVDYRRYRTAGHGFGLGTGTDAEGWLGDAVRFWEKHLGPLRGSAGLS
jgi:acetyl esterase/lipase